jgi:hypothetical protein
MADIPWTKLKDLNCKFCNEKRIYKNYFLFFENDVSAFYFYFLFNLIVLKNLIFENDKF